MRYNEHISPLIGNPNALSLTDLKRLLVGGEVSREELVSVLPDDLLPLLDDYMEGRFVGDVLSEGSDVLRQDKGRTEVYFWGMKHSGKTSAIGAILASQPYSFEKINETSALNRARKLCKAFGETGKDTLFPIEGQKSKVKGQESLDLSPQTLDSEARPSVINVDLKDHKGRLHPLALVEMSSTSVEQNILCKTQNDKIHFLCYDCSRSGKEQDDMFVELLDGLRKKGILQTSVGVYLLVTKVDSLWSVPPDYRHEMAQTLITADHLDLWQKVKNVCYEMKINDATPIPFTIGDIRLQEVMRVNLDCARSLIEKPIALKSHPYRTHLGSLLRTGSWWTSALVIMAVCASLVYGANQALSKIAPMPTAHIMPFDYKSYFDQVEAEQVKGGTYFRNRAAYDALRADIETERFVTTKDGKHLLKASDYIKCDKILNNDFAEILYGGMSYEFNQSEWNDGVLEKLNVEGKSLLRNPHISESKREALNRMLDIYYMYSEAQDVLALSRHCKTLEDVESVKENVELYSEEPFTNNLSLQEKLQTAVNDAYHSLACAICDEARDKYVAFANEWQRIDDTYIINIISEVREQKELKRRTLESCDSLIRKINHVQTEVDDDNDVVDALTEARRWIDRIRDKRTFLDL